MNIAILTVDHAYSSRVVNSLINEFGEDIKYIGESGVLLHNKSFTKSIIKYFCVSGWRYVIAQAIKLEHYKFRKKHSFHKSAKKNKIDVYKINDVNSREELLRLKHHKIDLVISVFFNQILKDDVINIPQKGVVNIHPAYLPDYKGVSPVFWALANNEKYSGVTIHEINTGIDTGNILARKKIKIENDDTEDSLYHKCVSVGIPLLIDVVKKIKNNKSIKKIENIGGDYYSLPTRSAVIKFFKTRKFFVFSDL